MAEVRALQIQRECSMREAIMLDKNRVLRELVEDATSFGDLKRVMILLVNKQGGAA